MIARQGDMAWGTLDRIVSELERTKELLPARSEKTALEWLVRLNMAIELIERIQEDL